MHGRRLTAIVTLVVAMSALWGAVGTPAATAAGVLVMGRHGHVHRADNRFISRGQSIVPPTSAVSASQPARAASVTVPTTLAKLAVAGEITSAEHTAYLNQWDSAILEEKHLSRPRAAQMDPVTEMIHDLAVAGELTPSRLPVLFLTLERNAQWWRSGSMLSYGERVQFQGSQLVWEYYTGEGIQLQVLGTFGEADGYFEAGQSTWPKLLSVMNEMIPLAVQRGGGLAWEYYFDWEGGKPPWVSAMAQATGIEALTNAFKASQDRNYLNLAHGALGILQTPPPTGVAESTPLGTRFLQYSFAPHEDIINAFLQTLVGLDYYAQASGDPTAQTLFSRGNAQAMAELPQFNTGAWSLYEPGESDDLSYHQLVTTFLTNLCAMTAAPVYCDTEHDFTADLSTPPQITQITHHAAPHRAFRLYFNLDKPAHVGIVLSNLAGTRTFLFTSADSEPGDDFWAVPKLAAGIYTVKLSGTDLADNYATTSGTLTVR
jgi:hypothetical protein